MDENRDILEAIIDHIKQHPRWDHKHYNIARTNTHFEIRDDRDAPARNKHLRIIVEDAKLIRQHFDLYSDYIILGDQSSTRWRIRAFDMNDPNSIQAVIDDIFFWLI